MLILGISTQSTFAQFTLVPSNKTPVLQFEFFDKKSPQTAYIVVKNLTNKKTDYLIQGVDGTYTQDGNAISVAPSLPQETVGKWIKFENNLLTLNPGQELETKFSIEIPDTIPPGTYFGGITLSEANALSEKKQNTSGANIKTNFSYPVWIIINGTQTTDYRVSNYNFTQNTFSFSFQNLGNTILVINPSITVTDKTGNYQRVLTANETTLYDSKESISIQMPIGQKPLIGQFSAILNVQILQKNLSTGTSEKIGEYLETISFTIIPWTLIGICLTTLIIFILLIIFLQIRKKSYLRQCRSYQIQPDDSLVTIAEKLNVSWKLLAKLNKLKPPYSLSKIKEITIPPANPKLHE